MTCTSSCLRIANSGPARGPVEPRGLCDFVFVQAETPRGWRFFNLLATTYESSSPIHIRWTRPPNSARRCGLASCRPSLRRRQLCHRLTPEFRAARRLPPRGHSFTIGRTPFERVAPGTPRDVPVEDRPEADSAVRAHPPPLKPARPRLDPLLRPPEAHRLHIARFTARISCLSLNVPRPLESLPA